MQVLDQLLIFFLEGLQPLDFEFVRIAEVARVWVAGVHVFMCSCDRQVVAAHEKLPSLFDLTHGIYSDCIFIWYILPYKLLLLTKMY